VLVDTVCGCRADDGMSQTLWVDQFSPKKYAGMYRPTLTDSLSLCLSFATPRPHHPRYLYCFASALHAFRPPLPPVCSPLHRRRVVDLLSSERTNKKLLRWLKTWHKSVFGQ